MRGLAANYGRATLLCCALLTAAAVGGGEAPSWAERDTAYRLAREAVARGEALPLHVMRGHLQRVAPGRVVATDYEFEFERWVYEFKIVDPQGRLRKVHLDARTGALVKISDY